MLVDRYLISFVKLFGPHRDSLQEHKHRKQTICVPSIIKITGGFRDLLCVCRVPDEYCVTDAIRLHLKFFLLINVIIKVKVILKWVCFFLLFFSPPISGCLVYHPV